MTRVRLAVEAQGVVYEGKIIRRRASVDCRLSVEPPVTEVEVTSLKLKLSTTGGVHGPVKTTKRPCCCKEEEYNHLMGLFESTAFQKY